MYEKYWDKNIPWTFTDLPNPPSYLDRRRIRYRLQDYMIDAIQFHKYKGKMVLEVGCGSGIDAAEFARFGAIITAVDASQLAIVETRKIFRERGYQGDIKLADALQLPLKDSSYDMVYSFGVLHHIETPGIALSEIHRVLKKDGEFISMWYNRDSILYGYSISHLGLEFERVKGAPHARAYSKYELNELLQRYKFKVESIKAYYNVVDLPTQRKVRLGLGDEYQLGWHLIAKATKL